MAINRNSSRYRETGIEGEWQPGSRKRVLRNLQSIRLKTEMDRAEADALERAENRCFEIITDETVFTADLICQMHRDWFGEIYEWAGRYRTVEMQKGNFRWPPAFRVPQNIAWLEDELLKEYLDAVVAGYGQDYIPLTGFFRACVEARLEEVGE